MTDTSKQWIKDLYEIKDQSALSWSVYFDGEFFTEFGDREDAKEYVSDQVAHWTRLIAKHAPKGEVDTSKERAEFEKWKQTHFDSSLNPCRWDDECEGYAAPNGGFAPEIQSAFEAWMSRAEQSTETPPRDSAGRVDEAKPSSCVGEHGSMMTPAERLEEQTLEERDSYHDWADRLAQGISEKFGVEIGEHSNCNNPWQNAMEVLAGELVAEAPRPVEKCGRCGHPADWHRADDSQNIPATSPALKFRCIGYDCEAPGPPVKDGCNCPDFAERRENR